VRRNRGQTVENEAVIEILPDEDGSKSADVMQHRFDLLKIQKSIKKRSKIKPRWPR